MFDLSFGGAFDGVCCSLIVCVFVWGWNSGSMNKKKRRNYLFKPT
jgi:hypothetical protein